MRKFGVLIILLGLSEFAWSHGDLHQRILEVSKKIEKNPDDFQLYQERGELYLKHQDHRHAIRDLRIYLKIDGPSNRLNYGLALAYFGIDRPRKTIRLLSSMVTEIHRDPKIYRLLARAYLALGNNEKSAKYFQKVLDHAIRPRPENYLELAAVYGLFHDHQEERLTLKKGISRLGLVPSLTQHLLNLYVKENQFNEAISLQTKIIEASLRREYALVDRAKIYQAMALFVEAASDLKQAQDAIKSRPSHVQSRSASLALMNEIAGLQKKKPVGYEQ